MIIVADENIFSVRDQFSDYGELRCFPGREICAADLKNADALLVRSTTRVDEKLLKNSSVQFVATATSGVDHIDVEYLAKRGISLVDAIGGNAAAVVDYCIAALMAFVATQNFNLGEKTVGIVGGGHVGGRLLQVLGKLNIECVVCDPFLEHLPYEEDMLLNPDQVVFLPIDEILKLDIISFHTPLTRTGLNPTHHLLNEKRLGEIQSGTLVINSSRGEVIDNPALLRRLERQGDLFTVLDVWDNEPDIDARLCAVANIATPHIAGYSVEAKHAATQLIHSAFCDYFQNAGKFSASTLDKSSTSVFSDESIDAPKHKELNEYHQLAKYILKAFPLLDISEQFKLGVQQHAAPEFFDKHRQIMLARREFSHYTVRESQIEKIVGGYLHSVGFSVENSFVPTR